MGLDRSTLPNALTVARILVAPGIFFLVFVPGFTSRVLAFGLFLLAGLSDVWDGHLARKYGWTSDFGKLMDPLADKLLMAATFVPFYILSHRPDVLGVGPLPFWGPMPLWVLIVIFGREALITLLRAAAVRRGVVLAAAAAGKQKALVQSVFVGATLLWYALESAALRWGWSGPVWRAWQGLHGSVLAASLALAVVLTLYSMAVYLRSWRSVVRSGA